MNKNISSIIFITAVLFVAKSQNSFAQNEHKMERHLRVTIMPNFSPDGSFAFGAVNNDRGEMVAALKNSFVFAGLNVFEKNTKYLVRVNYTFGPFPKIIWGGQGNRVQCRDIRGQIVDLDNNNEIVVTFNYDGNFDQIPVAETLATKLSQVKHQKSKVVTQPSSPTHVDSISQVSDVDEGIPITKKNNSNSYALIIGNEDYKKYQTGLEYDQNVLYAHNDATVFKEYLTKTLGVPERQVFVLTDATLAQMKREIERVTELAKITPHSELIFYYAGHGLPDMETREGYIIPVDVTASNLKDAFSLKDLYSKLASSNANKILVFLDACFSGGGRGENGLLAARTVKIKPKGDLIEGNIVVFTAATGEEVSLPLNEENHGLFTYYLLKKIKDTQGEITLEQLKNYLESEIPKSSLIENGIKQTPQVLVAPDLSDKWLSWKIQN